MLGTWLTSSSRSAPSARSLVCAAPHRDVVDTLARCLHGQLAPDDDNTPSPSDASVRALPSLLQCLLRLELVESALGVHDTTTTAAATEDHSRHPTWILTAIVSHPAALAAWLPQRPAAPVRAPAANGDLVGPRGPAEEGSRKRAPGQKGGRGMRAEAPAEAAEAAEAGRGSLWEWLSAGERVPTAAVSALVTLLLPSGDTPCVCRLSLLQVHPSLSFLFVARMQQSTRRWSQSRPLTSTLSRPPPPPFRCA